MTRLPEDVRFAQYVSSANASGCRLWVGDMQYKGYGRFWFRGRTVLAHRVAWELANGPIPEGLQLDHLCRNRACVNPAHLEPVTCRENLRPSPNHFGARTHCPQGHEYTPVNTRMYRGWRRCRACKAVEDQARCGRKGRVA